MERDPVPSRPVPGNAIFFPSRPVPKAFLSFPEFPGTTPSRPGNCLSRPGFHMWSKIFFYYSQNNIAARLKILDVIFIDFLYWKKADFVVK